MWIESSQNQKVKWLKSLKIKKNRQKEGVFLAEGQRFVSEIPKEADVVLFAMSASFVKEHSTADFEAKGQVYVFPDPLFASFCETEHPQGILAVVRLLQPSFHQVLEKENGFYLLAEELNDPGNLGTIIRTAHACGVDGVFLSKGCVDLYSPKVLRSTMGSIFHVPVFTEVDLFETMQRLREKNVTILAAHLKGMEYPYTVDCKKGCAFLIGNEARGIKEQTADRCDQLIKIPMPGGAESLNASVAAAVLLYEAVRQRITK